jgi:hypothetical protein
MKKKEKQNPDARKKVRDFMRFLENFKKKNPTIHDADGNDRPIHTVTDRRIARQAVASYITSKGKKINERLLKFKMETFLLLDNYYHWRASFYTPKKSKNMDVSILSFDGKAKVERRTNPTTVYTTDAIEAARELMMPVILEGTQGINPELYDLVTDAFTIKAHNMSFASLEKLRSYKLDHPDWKKAQQELDEGKQIVYRRVSLSIEEKDAFNKWQPVYTNLIDIDLPESGDK